MRLGTVTPVVNLNPRFDPPAWERDRGLDDVLEVARAAEPSSSGTGGSPSACRCASGTTRGRTTSKSSRRCGK
ncbi:MAG TPA: hypothetical protein VII76_01255 [Acidimicrobiales bacterium]